MAYEIGDLTGTVLAPSVDNPYGYPKDVPGGTVVDIKMVGDMLVFFQRMMGQAGITPNGLPDTTTNTFQLWLAFQKWVNPPWTITGVTFENSGANLWNNAGGGYGKFHYRVIGDITSGGIVSFAGVMENNSMSSPGSPLIMTLPAAIRPASTVRVQAWEDLGGAGSPSPVQLTINTAGQVIPESTGTGGTLVFMEGVSYKIGPDSY